MDRGFPVRAARSLVRRLRRDGVRPTLTWLHGHGLPRLTGVPTLRRYSCVHPGLYIGAQHGPRGKRRLERWGFRHAVSLREEFDDAAHGLALAHYCYLPTTDGTAPTLEHLRQGVAFIDGALRAGGKVYVHCLSGVGRAPTLAAAYLIGQGLCSREALALIRSIRPFVELSAVQVERLEQVEALTR
jgi:dual specificity MAP kinase phosphatase